MTCELTPIYLRRLHYCCGDLLLDAAGDLTWKLSQGGSMLVCDGDGEGDGDVVRGRAEEPTSE